MTAVISLLLRQARWVVVLAALAGLVSGAATLAIVTVLQHSLAGDTDAGSVVSFSAATIVVLIAGAASAILLIRLAQQTVHAMRLELCIRIVHAELRQVEQLGQGRLLAMLSDDVTAIAGAVQTVPLLFVNTAIVCGALLYVGFISPMIMLLLIVVLALAIGLYLIPMRSAKGHLAQAREYQDEQHEHLASVTAGNKELKLNAIRERILRGQLDQVGRNIVRESVRGASLQTIAGSWGQLLFLAIIGVMLFVGPQVGVSKEDLAGFTIAFLYLNTPLVTLINIVPVLSRAGISLDKIRSLDLPAEPETAAGNAAEPDGSGGLRLTGVSYAYSPEPGSRPFTVGPVDLTFQPGSITFIVGGNGSGKTTLGKLICGLYHADAGEVSLGGSAGAIDPTVLREHVGAVFSDGHLFPTIARADGRRDPIAPDELLASLGLTDRVELHGDAFSTLALSTGQRKRLALATVILEDRPILFLDEWAADQDPEFRQVFYTTLLPALRERGKLIIAITHDDRYFGCADQVLKLERGNVVYSGPAEEFASPLPGSSGTSRNVQ
ncbi:cyclic peptide export ABC transporter [Kribbella sp. NBC_01505]|uniref:cyclic peptide export ABC transporter n=1 Tax=Kribbella sp. NBC_01505 TaxID=2903580 RepID=UPI0038637ACF